MSTLVHPTINATGGKSLRRAEAMARVEREFAAGCPDDTSEQNVIDAFETMAANANANMREDNIQFALHALGMGSARRKYDDTIVAREFARGMANFLLRPVSYERATGDWIEFTVHTNEPATA